MDAPAELLRRCLRDEAWTPDLLASALAVDDGRAFLSVVVERLGDLFEPRHCETYARLFSQVIHRLEPRFAAGQLLARYQRIREPRKPPVRVRRVFVLSRVTLGADVAVTSVLLDGLKRRYPDAEIVYVGARKGWELFATDPRIHFLEAPYSRSGSLASRLTASTALRSLLDTQDAIVVDPDSRLTQLGLVPVCREESYYFFESRAYGGDGDEPLSRLAERWMREVFGIDDARPYVAPVPPGGDPFDITVSLGVGENLEKRLADPFEAELMRTLVATGASILVDKGGSPEEASRVDRVLLRGMSVWHGAFAPFAAQIARSRLYMGYDSSAQHVAAACGVPLITVFAGFPCERFLARWRPTGAGPVTIVRGDHPDPMGEVRRALAH